MPERAESTTRVSMEEILIIDDSQQICAMLAEYVLPELGYSSAIANTGRQGLNRLRQKLPDLILLDLQLPDISGLDLLRLSSLKRPGEPERPCTEKKHGTKDRHPYSAHTADQQPHKHGHHECGQNDPG